MGDQPIPQVISIVLLLFLERNDIGSLGTEAINGSLVLVPAESGEKFRRMRISRGN
jgi:hypothetical protein